MSRRVHDLTLANLDDLPEVCRSCVFWETTRAGRGAGAGRAETGRSAKEAWWQATQLEWGSPGKAVYVDDRFAGYAGFAPAAQVPRVRKLGNGCSKDAVLLMTLWIEPAHRGAGLATLLLQSVLRETHRRGARALESYGSRVGAVGAAPGDCVLPESFLRASGFQLWRDHALYPLLRLDLRQTARWQQSVESAVEGVIAALAGRERSPAPSLRCAPRDRRLEPTTG
ncbi:MAG: GNAT family N-acetyltransferase [Actinomycetota bacterium]|nr:GNAT family N-acetyltransferase [Actinomycetota bacterium]